MDAGQAVGKCLVETVHATDLFEAQDLFFAKGWTDGLPIIPPTRQSVDLALESIGAPADQVVGVIPPVGGIASLEKLAVNAVMAGCRPEYFPVVVAAVEAMLDERFNLRGVQATTHCSAPLVIVHGPLARDIGVNSGHNVFGQGWRANATIGRAVRLIMTNIGGALPGLLDKATMGHPGKYTYCIAENEEASPWEPLHVDRGFQSGDDAVTVYAGEAPHNVSDHVTATARGILMTAADVMSNLGSSKMGEALLVICPEHARTIAGEGWTRRDIQAFLFEEARKPLGKVRQTGAYLGSPTYSNVWPRWLDLTRDDTMIPIVGAPEDILVMVAGGAGTRSAFVSGTFISRSATRPVKARAGWPGGLDEAECKTCRI